MEKLRARHLLLGVIFGLALTPGCRASSKEKVLYAFGNLPDATIPASSLVFGTSGNLYGATLGGGVDYQGTVFELTPPAAGQTAWTETVLYSFQGGTDGSEPNGPLVFDSAGNLYGTTFYGGASNVGIVFELTPPAGGQTTWTETILYSFEGGSDGLNPLAGVVIDKAGRLYGTTTSGGAFGDSEEGNGTVFELTPPHGKRAAWTEILLHSFNAGPDDGGYPSTGVILDKSGNLYGTTELGGSGTSCGGNIPGCGTAYRLSPPHGQGVGSKRSSQTSTLRATRWVFLHRRWYLTDREICMEPQTWAEISVLALSSNY